MQPDAEQVLEQLAKSIRRCKGCPLQESRRKAVPGEGSARARAMLVGEAPGAQEDRLGRPFCGRSGAFLDGMLRDVGIRRDELFITSSVKCRPPGNRNPHADELSTCYGLWLAPQIDALEPRIVVLMGRVPVAQVLGETGPLADFHGQVVRRKGRQYLMTYHPAAAMRFPGPRAGMLQDFRRIPRLLASGG